MVTLMNIKKGRSLVEWGQPLRLLNMTSGLYLGIESMANDVDESSYKLVMVDGKDASNEKTAFCFVKDKVRLIIMILNK